MILWEAVVFYGCFCPTKAALKDCDTYHMSHKDFTLRSFSDKKLAKEIGASEIQLSHVFNKIFKNVYYMSRSSQGSGIETATEIGIISHSLLPCSWCSITFPNAP